MSLPRLLSATTALCVIGAPVLADFTMTVVHTNDVHSRIEPINRFDSTCSAEDNGEGKCFGGVARIKTKIDELRASMDNVVVVDAGDPFQGSLFYTTYKGQAAVEFMNATGYDVMAVGNHEFDDGPEALGAFLDKAEFPVVSGNIDVSVDGDLAGRVLPHVLLDVNGETVAIVSVLATDTVETSSPGPTVVFEDEITHLQGKVAALEATGVDKIIAVNHVGTPLDLRIAAEVAGIDAVVGGHSHTLFSSSDPDAAYTYPYWVSGPGDALVPVVQAYAYSKYVGALTLIFDDAGNVVDAYGDTHLLDASVAEDPDILARVQELGAPLDEIRQQVVAEAAAPIDGDRSSCRAGECQMGNLVAEAMLDRVKSQGVTIAIQNGGGLRASIDAGPITMGEVMTVLPFQNTLATFQLTGAGIVDALENGVSRVEDGAGRFPQVAGLKYTWSAQAEPGARITSVEVMADGAWAPIGMDTVYGVVSNNYMRGGGDGYATFTEGMNAYDFGPGLEVVVADFLAAKGPYSPFTDGRISQE
ncbi:MAG: 5'-nucleotidase C-terminal domain-containing protein [Pseudomonadota bacterium]